MSETSGSQPMGESPGGRPMGAIGITLITIYFILVALLIFHSLVVFWPQSTAPGAVAAAAGGCRDGRDQVEVFVVWKFCLLPETQLFFVVMSAGALGGLVHALRSFYWYAGCRKLVLSWAGFYITLPVLGATMATIFYLVVRGGFFSGTAVAKDMSSFGFAAMAALIGMFTEQASMKLKDIADTLFQKVPKGTDHADSEAPVVEKVEPAEGPLAGGTAVTLTGQGFDSKATVTFGGTAATDVTVGADGKSITATTPAAAAAGAVAVEVTNPDGQKGALANGFTYV